MKQNKIYAVTGGIGSGKSTVMQIIKEAGYATFSCDRIYGELLTDGGFIKGLCDIFGKITDDSGNLDRKKLADIVFDDAAQLNKLNDYTHPRIYNEMFKRAKEVNGICFCEVPLLFESGAEGLFDGVIVVMRDVERRIKSVTERDKLPEQDVKKRISKQFDYNSFDFAMYYVIHNDGNLTELVRQTKEIINKITKNDVQH